MTAMVRNREEFWRARTARKRYRCQSDHVGCVEHIEPASRYIELKLPPNSDIGNEGWWLMRICVPCGSKYHADLVDQLGLTVTEGETP